MLKSFNRRPYFNIKSIGQLYFLSFYRYFLAFHIFWFFFMEE